MSNADRLRTAVEAEDFDGGLDILDSVASERPLTPGEFVKMGQWILLSEGRAGRTPPDALAAFQRALELDDDYVPALNEVGWYYYSVEDDANRARPYFDRAVDELRRQIQEVADGFMNCIHELEGGAAVAAALQEFRHKIIDIERISENLLPTESDSA